MVASPLKGRRKFAILSFATYPVSSFATYPISSFASYPISSFATCPISFAMYPISSFAMGWPRHDMIGTGLQAREEPSLCSCSPAAEEEHGGALREGGCPARGVRACVPACLPTCLPFSLPPGRTQPDMHGHEHTFLPRTDRDSCCVVHAAFLAAAAANAANAAQVHSHPENACLGRGAGGSPGGGSR